MRTAARTLAASMLALSLVGCAADADDANTSGEVGDEPEEAFVVPERVSIRIDNAVIRPWDPAQELWDDSQSVSSEDIAAIGQALGVPEPYAAVTSIVADLAADHWAPPDPYGYAEVLVDGTWQARVALGAPKTNFDNTFNPMF